jgi:phytol kinase
VGFVGLLVAAELWRHFGKPTPEATRKLSHLGSGIGCLALPFLIRSAWVVLALAVVMSASFALSQRFRLLPSLHAVNRKSRGSEYYPLSIFLVYVIAYDQPAIYVSSVLVLAIGDALAALIGVRYGSVRYEVEESQKSLEGSLTFLIIAFLAIHLPLLLMTDLPRAHCVLSALLVATLVTMFEAVALGGADNLFVPIGVAFALQRITTNSLTGVVSQNLTLLGLALVVILVTRRMRWFNIGAMLVVILYTYGVWALGDWLWALPPLLVLLGSLILGLRAGKERTGTVKVRYVAGVTLPPFLFLMAGQPFEDWRATDYLYGPYLASMIAAGVFWVRAHSRYFRVGPQIERLLVVVVVAWICVALPPWLLLSASSLSMLFLPALAAGVVTAGEALWTASLKLETQPQRWTARRFNFTVLAGVLVLLVQLTGLVPIWTPHELARTNDMADVQQLPAGAPAAP